MDNLDNEIYNKACEKFTSLGWRRMFITMTDVRKKIRLMD